MLKWLRHPMKSYREHRERVAAIRRDVYAHEVEDNYNLQGGRPDPDPWEDLHDGDTQS